MFKALLLKELKQKFRSPWVYALASIFNLVVGWLFFNRIHLSATNPQGGIEQDVLLPLVGNINFLLFLISPILCMKTFSLESKNNTLTLLYMSSLSDLKIYGAKFFSVLAEAMFLLLFSLIIPLILVFSGYDNWGLLLALFLGLVLCLCTYLVISIFASTLSSNMMISLLISYGILFIFFLASGVASIHESLILGQIFSYLSLATHVEMIFRGVLVSYDILYFLSLFIFFQILSMKSMEARKW
jgi:ABC-2 type transport system permease protein